METKFKKGDRVGVVRVDIGDDKRKTCWCFSYDQLRILDRESQETSQQAMAWIEVCRVLDEVVPDWANSGAPGIECAVAAIRGLHSKSVNVPVKEGKVLVDEATVTSLFQFSSDVDEMAERVLADLDGDRLMRLATYDKLRKAFEVPEQLPF